MLQSKTVNEKSINGNTIVQAPGRPIVQLNMILISMTNRFLLPNDTDFEHGGLRTLLLIVMVTIYFNIPTKLLDKNNQRKVKRIHSSQAAYNYKPLQIGRKRHYFTFRQFVF